MLQHFRRKYRIKPGDIVKLTPQWNGLLITPVYVVTKPPEQEER